jgi:DNA-directed RNA polymerase alpha subunit
MERKLLMRATKKRQTRVTPAMKESMGLSVGSLPHLSVRTRNKLEDHHINTLEQLLYCCPLRFAACKRGGLGDLHMPCDRIHLFDIPNFGEKTLEEIYIAISEFGFERYQ